MRIGIDAGGTFTDVCVYDETSQEIRVLKVSSTPADPGEAVLEGVRRATAGGPGRIDYLAHGTTVATNALIEGRGAKTGLITTAGFGDLLDLGRQRRPKLYDFAARKPEPLVEAALRREVTERIRYDGSVARALDPDEVRAEVRRLRDAGVEAVAVCFLYSYLRPEHERVVRDILAEELPDAFRSVSHEVLPEFREFERLSTVVVNAFIGPMMQRYLSRLRDRLAGVGLAGDPKLMQSNGGVMPFPLAERFPVRTVLSGPSAGVVGAATIAGHAGFGDVITFDMGGTSCDVSMVRDGRPDGANGLTLDGRPIHSPMLDISTVGAGGGSIAWVDSGGHLKVGPRSAGAAPGPACYGLGNDEPTVTDANVVLGILNQTHLLGGTMPIDADLSHAAVERLGRRLGIDTVAAAQGIISVVTANMARLIRVISVQRGFRPADFVLFAFGGAGPLHSARLAAELDMPRTLVPPTPGALSALGLLMADIRRDFTRTSVSRLSGGDAGDLAGILAALHREADAWLTAERVPIADRRIACYVEARYVGQNYELTVPVDPASHAWVDEAEKGFHAAHRLRYGYDTPEEPIEAVTFRVEAVGVIPKASPRTVTPGPADPLPALTGHRGVYLPEAGGRVDVPVYERALLGAGHVVPGPALVEQYDTTTFILPTEVATVDAHLNIVTRSRRSA